MDYEILLHPKAKNFLSKLDQKIKERIKNKLKELKKSPDGAGKHLKYSIYWSLRIGNYGVIYKINKKKKEIIILFIGHRKNVYDDLSKFF
jgi:mRNA interferase RelE/StbE